MIVQNRVRLYIEREVNKVGSGIIIRIPANTMRHAETIGDKVVFDRNVFAPPRGD